ncbi:MAG TPA: response regulator transcription factor [Acidimicrobiales bacterium]|jgi:DNA-binding response OmpR family regulator|nr:response regulator transcription factor [Acidimicrobiales bacterium]
MRVLVAEDDAPLRSVLERGLREHGYTVDAVADGDQAVAHLREYEYEVAILDWRMPKRSGLEVVQGMRQQGDRTPTLMLTARDATADRITGLNLGADDYLVKPFDFSELVARLQALQRRPALTVDPQIVCGDLHLDTITREVTKQGEPVTLTATEFGLLELLLRRAPAVVTRRNIAVQIWDNEADAVGSNTIDVHVARLRAKLGSDGARIETVRGTGYRLVEA